MGKLERKARNMAAKVLEVSADVVDVLTGTTSVVDAPTVDAPTVDAPTVDAPTVDAPTVDAPTVDAPTVYPTVTLYHDRTIAGLRGHRMDVVGTKHGSSMWVEPYASNPYADTMAQNDTLTLQRTDVDEPGFTFHLAGKHAKGYRYSAPGHVAVNVWLSAMPQGSIVDGVPCQMLLSSRAFRPAVVVAPKTAKVPASDTTMQVAQAALRHAASQGRTEVTEADIQAARTVLGV